MAQSSSSGCWARERESNWEGRKEGQAKQGGLGLRKAAICLAVLQMPLALLQARCRVCFVPPCFFSWKSAHFVVA